MKLFGGRSALLFGALLLAFAPAAARPAETAPPAPAQEVFRPAPAGVVHVASGFVYPRQLAELAAVGERAYAPDNVMVRYGAGGPQDGSGWLDLFIYPADASLDAEAADVGRIIAETYVATPIAPPRALPKSASDGRSGWFTAQIEGKPMRTGYVLVHRGGWSMKVRATVPVSGGEAAFTRVLDAIASIQWDWSPSRRPANSARVAAR